MKRLALILALWFSPSLAQDDMPEGMYLLEVDLQFACTDSFLKMIEILEEKYLEIPIAMSHLSQHTTFVLFVNKRRSTSSLVITKRFKDREESCVIFGGQSNGTSFSVNPNPVFPDREIL